MKAIPLFLLLAACQQKPEIPQMGIEEIVLTLQCDEKHGLMAVAHGPHGVWYTCYRKHKKLWSVRL